MAVRGTGGRGIGDGSERVGAELASGGSVSSAGTSFQVQIFWM